jgi:hypothetical protein
MDTKVATYAPQVHPVYIHPQGLLTKFVAVAAFFLDRCVGMFTDITSVSLAACCGSTYFVLFVFSLTFWTVHPSILLTFFATLPFTLFI